MPNKFDPFGGGTNHQYPIGAFGRQRSASRETYDTSVLCSPRYRLDWFEDFRADLSPTDIAIQGSLYDLSAAGTPTQALVADAAHGQLQVKLSNDNQQSVAGYSWGDQLDIPAAAFPYFEIRFGFATLPTTAEYAMFGLISAFAGNPITQWSNIGTRMLFRLNASGLLYADVDDATTDSGLVTTGTTLVAATWYTASFLMRPDGVCRFWLADAYGANESKKVDITAAAMNASTAMLQPVAWVQKDSGTTQPDLRVDYLRASHHRIVTAIA